jgi:hypothetical protein
VSGNGGGLDSVLVKSIDLIGTALPLAEPSALIKVFIPAGPESTTSD